MLGEMTLWVWMGGLVVFAAGGGLGYFIARQIKSQRTCKLEQQLDTTRGELSGYRDEVDRHFLKTSLLLSKLTDDYREVYEHLATGAQRLCKEQPGTPVLDLPETRILPTAENDTSPQANETPTATPLTATADKIPETTDDMSGATVTTAVETTWATAPAEDVPLVTAKPPSAETDNDGVPLGAESTPAVDTKLKRHEPPPSIH